MAGGVAANASVRAAMQEVASSAGLTLVCPPPRLCTDNGVMVAWAGAERLALGLAEPPPPPLGSANGASLPERLTVPVRIAAEVATGILCSRRSMTGPCDVHPVGGQALSAAAVQLEADSGKALQSVGVSSHHVPLYPHDEA